MGENVVNISVANLVTVTLLAGVGLFILNFIRSQTVG